MDSNPAETPANETSEQPTEKKKDFDPQITGAFRRRTMYASAWAGLQRLRRAYKDEKIRLRLNDRITTIVCVLSIALMVPVLLLQLPLAFFASCVAAIGCAGTMACVFYIINRMGVLEALTGRQAVLVWQLMMVMLVMGLLTASSLISFVFFLNMPAPPPVDTSHEMHNTQQ